MRWVDALGDKLINLGLLFVLLGVLAQILHNGAIGIFLCGLGSGFSFSGGEVFRRLRKELERQLAGGGHNCDQERHHE